MRLLCIAGFCVTSALGQAITLQRCSNADYMTFKVNADATVSAPAGQCVGISSGDVSALSCTGSSDQKWNWLANGCVASVAGERVNPQYRPSAATLSQLWP